jgi:hypothetical protein
MSVTGLPVVVTITCTPFGESIALVGAQPQFACSGIQGNLSVKLANLA